MIFQKKRKFKKNWLTYKGQSCGKISHHILRSVGQVGKSSCYLEFEAVIAQKKPHQCR
jgi:hypothetical protein